MLVLLVLHVLLLQTWLGQMRVGLDMHFESIPVALRMLYRTSSSVSITRSSGGEGGGTCLSVFETWEGGLIPTTRMPIHASERILKENP